MMSTPVGDIEAPDLLPETVTRPLLAKIKIKFFNFHFFQYFQNFTYWWISGYNSKIVLKYLVSFQEIIDPSKKFNN